jgi:hypothetical protein
MAANFKKKHSAIEADAVQFMSEFATYLIEAGVSAKRFERIVRLGYFLAAAKAARFGNKKLNQSAVAAMTGLTRVQVRQLARQSFSVPVTSQDRIDQLIHGWTTDASFTTPELSPKKLRLSGRGKKNFQALVRRYGGDVPPRSLLRELQRRGLVTVRDDYISLRAGGSPSRGEYRLKAISRSLARLIDGAGRVKVQSPIRTINLEVYYPAPSEVGRILLHKRAEEGIRNFLQGLKEMGFATAISSPPPRRKSGGLACARLALITEEVDS